MKYRDIPFDQQAKALALACDFRRADEQRAATRSMLTGALRTHARALHSRGLVQRDIGYLLGISHQRVSQILAA